MITMTLRSDSCHPLSSKQAWIYCAPVCMHTSTHSHRERNRQTKIEKEKENSSLQKYWFPAWLWNGYTLPPLVTQCFVLERIFSCLWGQWHEKFMYSLVYAASSFLKTLCESHLKKKLSPISLLTVAICSWSLSLPPWFISNWQQQTITLASQLYPSQEAHQSIIRISIQSLLCVRQCWWSVKRIGNTPEAPGDAAIWILYKTVWIATLRLISSVIQIFPLSGFSQRGICVCWAGYLSYHRNRKA